MNEMIKECFSKYKNNMIEWQEFERFMLKPNAKEQWLQDFYKVMGKSQLIYDDNKAIIAKLENALNDLNNETASILLDGVWDLYINDYMDQELFIHILEKLFPFYEATDDYSRQVIACAMLQNCHFDVDNPEGNGTKTDITYIRKGMEYLKHYKLLNESARYRVWIMYYNFIVRCVDYRIVSLSEALDCYDEIMKFSERPDIKKLDAECADIQAIKGFLSQTMYIGIGIIDEADADTRRRFYEHTKKYFDDNSESIKSLYELPSELYASYLYNEFYIGKINPNQVFEKYLDYFIYKFHFIKTQSEFDSDEIIQCINAIIFLTKLGKHVTDSELINRALDLLIDFVQARWLKSTYALAESVNDMLSKVCLSLLEYEVVGIDKEKIISQLIVQRDINVYISSKITAEIAVAIYREVSEKNVGFFDEIESIQKTEWKDYLYYSSLFHDIGLEKIMGCVVERFRPLFDSEKIRHNRHVEYGTEIFSKIPSISKYIDAIRGHHAFFNGEDEYNSGYDRHKTDLAPLIDILALSVYIEHATDPYFDFEHCCKNFSFVMHDISLEKNKRFNGDLIEIIQNSKILQRQIERIVTSTRDDIVYDVCHNWEQIKLSQDEDSTLNEIELEILAFRNSRDKEAFKPYLAKLEHIARHTQKDEVRAKAYYSLMRYHFISLEYNEGLQLEEETIRLLKLTKNKELLAHCYINTGTIEQVRGNLEEALLRFLTGRSIAMGTPGCEEDISISNLSIASIYLMNIDYSKAKEYFELVNPEILKLEDKVNYLCMNGLCCANINDGELVKSCHDELEDIVKKSPEYVSYPIYIYLAIFSNYLNDEEARNKYISIINETKIEEEDVAYCTSEMFMYLHLLHTLKRYDEMSKTLDIYIDIVKNNPSYASILGQFAAAKMSCIAIQNKLEAFYPYQEMVGNAYVISGHERAKHLEEIEEVILRDIKLRKEHDEYADNQEILEESVKKAQSDSEQKSKFLSSMSHEIRTPINAILGLNEMILRESNEDDILQYASDIHNAGKQLLGIINDVLDYSKIEAGKMEIVPQRYDLGEFINDIKNMMEPKFDEKNLQFIVRCNASVPNVLFGDDLRIKQILLNLLSNAYKYTKEGFVQFAIDYEKKDEQSVIVKYSVKDTGIGLKPEQIEKLAIPFERFDLVKNRGVEGTGLGMSIVMKLLEQMDSKLSIESEYSKGSVFSFEIEQGVIEWRKVGKLDEARKVFIKKNLDKHNLITNSLYAPKAKILVVDDNAVNLRVASALLKRTGMQISTAMSGQECIDLCAQNVYHIILLDHMMPEMDGIETLRKIKESKGPNATVPVIALTANVVESIDDFYKKQGFDSLISKPINAEKMEEIIAYYLPDYLLETK